MTAGKAALLAAVLTLATVSSTVLDGNELVHLTGPGVRDVIIGSDEMWILAILESDEKCGNDCRTMRKDFAKLELKSKGLFRFAYTNAGDNIVVQDGSLKVAGAYFNISAIPAMIVWPAGPKRLGKGFRMEHETLQHMLGRGYNMFFNNLRMFVASAITHPVRSKSMLPFMTKEAPLLPRVLLLSTKTETTMTYAALSTQFGSRGVFGQGQGTDATLLAAFGSPTLPALAVSPQGPHMPPPAAGNLTEGVYAGWLVYPASGSEVSYGGMRAWLDASLPQTSVPVLTGPPSYRIHCGDRTDVTVCFIAVLPPDEIAALRSFDAGAGSAGNHTGANGDDPRPAATLRRVASRTLMRMDWDNLASFKEVDGVRLPLAFSAVDSEEQAAFAANMRASAPGLIALNQRKRVFTVYKGAAFSDASVYEFVLEVMDKALAVQGTKESYAYGAGVEPLPEHTVNLEKIAEVPQLKQQREPTPAPAAPAAKKVKKVKKVVKKKKAAAVEEAAEGETKGEL